MRSRVVAVGLALTVTTLAGCGGGGSSAVKASPTPTATTTAKAKPTKAASTKTAIAKAVKAYSADLVAGKGTKAYPMLSAHCRTVITASAFNALAKQAHTTYPHAKLKKVTVVDVKGSKAHVTYTYSQAVLNQAKQSWVKEHGAWRWNGC